MGLERLSLQQWPKGGSGAAKQKMKYMLLFCLFSRLMALKRMGIVDNYEVDFYCNLLNWKTNSLCPIKSSHI